MAKFVSVSASSQLVADSGLFVAPLDAANNYAPINTLGVQLSPGTLPTTVTQVRLAGQVTPVSASIAFGINSTSGGFGLPNMTLTQRNALIPCPGMKVYNTTSQSEDSFINGNWVEFAAGAGNGNVVGPAGAVANDIAIFGDDTGLLLADSGVGINAIAPLVKFGTASVINQLSNLGYIQFNSTQSPAIFVDSLSPMNFQDNDTLISTVFTGAVPGDSSSVSALVELQSDAGVLLLSRLTLTQLNGLSGLTAGMIAYDSANHVLRAYQGNPEALSWQTFGSVTSVGGSGFITTSLAGSPIIGAGNLEIANSTAQSLLGFATGTGVPTNVLVDGTTIIWGANNTLHAVQSSANVASVSNADGTLTISPTTGAVVASISASYVGQASITTLGTIASGTWNANDIAVNHGGTGVDSFTASTLIAGGTTPSGALQSLTAGSPGQLLKSNGADELPTWVDVGGVGTVTSVGATPGGFLVTSVGPDAPIIATGTIGIATNAGLANNLLGFNGSGVPTAITAGTNITINSGVISSSGGGLTPVFTQGTYYGANFQINQYGQTTGYVTNTLGFIDNISYNSVALPNNVGLAYPGTSYPNFPMQLPNCTLLGVLAGQFLNANPGDAARDLTIIGAGAAQNILTFQQSVFIGSACGFIANGVYAFGANCVVIGDAAGFTNAGGQQAINRVAIGQGCINNTNNSWAINSGSSFGYNFGINTLTPAYTLDIGAMPIGGVGASTAVIQIQSSGSNVPATPASGNVLLYSKTGKPSYMLSTGAEQTFLGISSSFTPQNFTLSSLSISSSGVVSIEKGIILTRTAVSLTSSDYTILATDYILAVTSTTNTHNVVLPTAGAGNSGQSYIVKDEGGNAGTSNITISVSGGGNIDGSSTVVFSKNYSFMQFYSNGSAWFTG